MYLPKGVNYWGELLPGSVDEASTGTEALFLTASYQGKLVLGARVPMEGIMFPFLAQFYEGNIVGGAAAWARVKQQDLVVRARVCGTGAYPPCATPLLKAASISKFLPEVRAPASSSSTTTGSGGSGGDKAEKEGSSKGGEGEVIARNVRIGASLLLQPPGEATTLELMRAAAGGGGGGGGGGKR